MQQFPRFRVVYQVLGYSNLYALTCSRDICGGSACDHMELLHASTALISSTHPTAYNTSPFLHHHVAHCTEHKNRIPCRRDARLRRSRPRYKVGRSPPPFTRRSHPAQMISKLLYRVPSPRKKTSAKPVDQEAEENPNTIIIGGMYFDTDSSDKGAPLLLPDESCLAEDVNCFFNIHCEREGFHLFGWRDVNFTNIHAKVYLTTYRVSSFLEPDLRNS